MGYSTDCLAVYDINIAKNGSPILLDEVEVIKESYWGSYPSVDSSHRVYVPCGESGVSVFSYQNTISRLIPDPLTCVRHASCICANTADTVFVGVWDTKSIYLVDVSTDTVIRQLERPAQVRGSAHYISVLGQTVLVCCTDNSLVTYRSDSQAPGTVLHTPRRLGRVTSITTDSHSSSFLITDERSVYALDDKLLWHRIYVGRGKLRDCAVVESQLWLGYEDGVIAVLSSQ